MDLVKFSTSKNGRSNIILNSHMKLRRKWNEGLVPLIAVPFVEALMTLFTHNVRVDISRGLTVLDLIAKSAIGSEGQLKGYVYVISSALRPTPDTNSSDGRH